MPESNVPTEGGYWHDGHSVPKRKSVTHKESWYSTIGQKLLEWSSQANNHTAKKPALLFRRSMSIAQHFLRVRTREHIQDTLTVPLHFSIAPGTQERGRSNYLQLIRKRAGRLSLLIVFMTIIPPRLERGIPITLLPMVQ
jgi:hypothetical protein